MNSDFRPNAVTVGTVQDGLIIVRSTVQPNEDGSHLVILWERNAAHPGGECLIAGPKPVGAAITFRVAELIKDGVIEEIAGDGEDEHEL